jgi:putative ABC transport system permease protein
MWTMEQYLASSIAPRRFNVLVLGIFAGVALVLAGTGLYGVISYAVTQRTHEIGVRIALGAQRGDVAGQALGLTLVGVAIGLAGALALTRVMSGMLFAVSSTDPAAFVTAPVLLCAIAAVASYVPARRAAAADPSISMRGR